MTQIARALEAAARRPPAQVARLVDDRADGCDGLVVDRYGPVVRLEIRARAWPDETDALAAAFLDTPLGITGVTGVVGVLRPSGGRGIVRVLAGEVPVAHVVDEAGVRFLVRARDEDAPGVGLFVDHKEGRALVRARAHGAVVLNLFAHAGAFGAAAVAGGAARVDHVDAAKKCAPWAALNLALNGADPRQHRFLVDDALDVIVRAAKRGPAYDIVICDPPTTAVRPRGARFHVEQDLGALARDCIRALAPGGALLLSTNDRALSVDAVKGFAWQGAEDAGRALASLEEIPLPVDVRTAADPERRPMRGVIVVVT